MRDVNSQGKKIYTYTQTGIHKPIQQIILTKKVIQLNTGTESVDRS
jgi:hypothetical protein